MFVIAGFLGLELAGIGSAWSCRYDTLYKFNNKKQNFCCWTFTGLTSFLLPYSSCLLASCLVIILIYSLFAQGTIMSLAAFTQPDIVEMVEAAALLCPISYLGHITAPFVRRMVNMHLDQVFPICYYWMTL